MNTEEVAKYVLGYNDGFTKGYKQREREIVAVIEVIRKEWANTASDIFCDTLIRRITEEQGK